MYYSDFDSPIGKLTLFATDKGLTSLVFPNDYHALEQKNVIRKDQRFSQIKKELNEYFKGRRKQFTLALDIQGTNFQLKTWEALQSVSYGKTISYKHLAEKIGRPTASRAVGRANAVNKLPIIIPCHRVIGTNNALTGYVGGLNVKHFLLTLEGAIVQ